MQILVTGGTGFIGSHPVVELLNAGDEVVIGFGHNYREWNGRYFNEVRMYKCEKVGGVAQQPEQEKPAEQPKPQQAQMDFEEKGKDDDLPF